MELIPQDQNRQLYGDYLSPPRCHPGSQGIGLFITNKNSFLEVSIKVMMCEKAECHECTSPKFIIWVK